VATLTEFVAAMALRRGRGDSDVVCFFDAGGNGWAAGAASSAAAAERRGRSAEKGRRPSESELLLGRGRAAPSRDEPAQRGSSLGRGAVASAAAAFAGGQTAPCDASRGWESSNGGGGGASGRVAEPLQRGRSESLTRRAGAPRDLPEAGVAV
jgi:hypothetical protein